MIKLSLGAPDTISKLVNTILVKSVTCYSLSDITVIRGPEGVK